MRTTRREALLATLGCLAFWRVRKPKYEPPAMKFGGWAQEFHLSEEWRSPMTKPPVLTEADFKKILDDVRIYGERSNLLDSRAKKLLSYRSLSRGART